jgi:hypothetical protein
MAEVLANATVDETLAVLDAITDMDELFAASIALQLEPWRHPAIRDRMTELLDSPRTGPMLRRNIRMALAKKTGHLTRDGWPDLPGLLAEVDTEGPAQ